MNKGLFFDGFQKETFEFLNDLAKNNNKKWFDKNRNSYEKFVLEPLRGLVTELGPFMQSIDPDFEIVPAIGKTISRIYRDTRFSKNKEPYRPVMWIVFKRPVKFWQDDPGYFFEISHDSYRFGMGFYYASSKTMKSFRNMIDSNPVEFKKAISFYRKQDMFNLEGDKYKKFIDNKHDEKIQEWYQRKTLCLISNRKIDAAVMSYKITEDLIYGFDLVSPLYNFLRKVKEASLGENS